MKHFIYKTTHKNGKYYIGRHSTDNIDDGYLGSGRWPRSIKDKASLTREILEFADNMETLVELERKYLTEYYGQPGCMNQTPDPIGFDTANNPMKRAEVAEKLKGENHWTNKNPEKILKGENHWMNKNPEAKKKFIENNPNKDGKISRRTAELGRNIFQTNNPSIWRSEQGIHHWQDGKSPNAGGKLNKKLIEEGRHNFLGPDLNKKRIAEGRHNLVGSASNLSRLAEGRHPSQMKKVCEYCSKEISVGMYKRWHGDNCKSKKE